jgi:hypothetical protein
MLIAAAIFVGKPILRRGSHHAIDRQQQCQIVAAGLGR